MFHSIFIDNDNVIETTIVNSVTGLPINDATVQVTLYDSDGGEVTGQAWPTTMVYAPTSDGIYRASLKAELQLVQAEKYTAVVTIETSDSITAKKTCRLQAADNDCQPVGVCA